MGSGRIPLKDSWLCSYWNKTVKLYCVHLQGMFHKRNCKWCITSISLHAKSPLFVPDFNQNCCVSTKLIIIFVYKFLWKSVHCFSLCFVWTDGVNVKGLHRVWLHLTKDLCSCDTCWSVVKHMSSVFR